jgi:pyruvate formate lyase activating enzyme
MTRQLERPLITNIHRFALDDGPGIRTTVFLKGCPLSCEWCHNPESMDPTEEVAFQGQLCIGCADCLRDCPHGAITMDSAERINRDLCTACGVCTKVCPTTALRMVGCYHTPSELTETLLKDRLFFETSKGGVTFSGGEPTLFPKYVATVAEKLHENGIHTAIQTCGHFDPVVFKSVLLPHLDLIYFDLKFFDPQQHKAWTGVANENILANFLDIVQCAGSRVVPRIPLVPGITATEENLSNLALFLRDSHATSYELLAYNSGGIPKRTFLGKPLSRALAGIRPDLEAEKKYRKVFYKTWVERDGINHPVVEIC